MVYRYFRLVKTEAFYLCCSLGENKFRWVGMFKTVILWKTKNVKVKNKMLVFDILIAYFEIFSRNLRFNCVIYVFNLVI